MPTFICRESRVPKLLSIVNKAVGSIGVVVEEYKVVGSAKEECRPAPGTVAIRETEGYCFIRSGIGLLLFCMIE